MKKQFIAVEGPIGVGKSSLAHKLSQTFNYYEEKEIVNENPFLSDFYEDISKWSFQTEMFFLCNRYKQFQDLEAISTGIVSDYHIYKNKIFANNTLTPSEFNKFSRIYDILTEDLEMPNVIIFLDADLEILKKRIALRNRSFEHQIEDDYLLNLKRDYNAYYRSLKADGESVIRIDTTDLDFMKQENDYNYILDLVQPLIGGKDNE
ncbi:MULTISPECIES: deoxynucleoside kinase [Staphylococcus]|uniref:deoxynucleoside kinase n=1 Tax=Staphylococcus TaxID=1279 RepID=UPI0008A5B345|nr:MULTISPECIES: deoxynucleoside kinase [Staphylococcus]MDK7752403.1 deoxynucleoside kinase [Staphylococcus sp. UMB10092B]OFQ87969.1 deoxyguanosine kinase [Staphylococcus sp. HMSC065A08]OHO41862.1 deoxyguanosine kinase [Staphylococcus sp. HMSC034G07]OIS31185.1 deoxyguanosine kinase [Staphylococcus cohnii]OIS32681.1 deoxyguanosine kinase [Staphylococcus cohnii]